jgi:hypothetical protein
MSSRLKELQRKTELEVASQTMNGKRSWAVAEVIDYPALKAKIEKMSPNDSADMLAKSIFTKYPLKAWIGEPLTDDLSKTSVWCDGTFARVEKEWFFQQRALPFRNQHGLHRSLRRDLVGLH